MIAFDYLPETDIFHISVEQTIENLQIRRVMRKIATEYQNKKNLYIITDYSRGGIETDPAYLLVNLRSIEDELNHYFTSHDSIYNAYIVTEKDLKTRTLLKIFLDHVNHIENFHGGFFEDYDGALHWLQNQQKTATL